MQQQAAAPLHNGRHASVAQQPGAGAPPQQPVACAGSVLVGDAYYGAKDALFTAEQHVLRLNRFRVHVAHAYKHLEHMAHTLLGAGCSGGGGGGRGGSGASGGLARAAGGSRHSSGSGEEPRGTGARLTGPPAWDQPFGGDSGGSGGGGGRAVSGGSAAMSRATADLAARAGMALLHDVLTITALGAIEAPEALAAAALVAALALVEGTGVELDGGMDISSPAEGVRCCGGAASAVAARLVAAAGLDAGHVGCLAHGMLRLVAESVA